jgi:hypothetical protein
MPRTVSRRAKQDEYDEDEEVRQGGPRSRYDDDEDDDRPSRPARRSRRDEEDDEPRSSRRRSRDEDDDDAPRSSRRRSRDTDDDERPKRSETSRRRGQVEDDDEDGERGSSGAVSTTIGRGRDGLRKHRETHKGGNFPDKFKVEEDKKIIVKFLDDDFFVTYYEHWIDEFRGQKRQMSFVCLGDDCPLCEIGDSPSFFALINVLDFTKPKSPAVAVWYASADPGGKIEELINDLEELEKHLTDEDTYAVVSKKKGKNGFFSYAVSKVKARDLEEDYRIAPLDDDELDDFGGQVYDENIVRITPRKTLREIADELSE